VTGIVRATGLVKRYDKTVAVAGLDLDVAQGEIFGLVGPNGAGKTTTLRILATLLVPDRGDAEIAGASVRRNPNDVRRVLGYMPDSFGVYDDMKVWEYLDFFARCYGIPADRRRRMIGDLLELVDLGSKRDVYVQGLSRGMQQRLCLAHTLVHDPLVLLLDETDPGGFVREWKPVYGITPDKHRAYAAQWFTLALVLLLIYVGVNTRRHSEGSH